MIWTTLILTVLGLKFIAADHDGSSDPLDWLREGIPGEPGNLFSAIQKFKDTLNIKKLNML